MGEHNGSQDVSSVLSMADRLRMTLNAARGNVQIRERLREIVADPERFGAITLELGTRHALVRELLALARHGNPDTERAA